LGVFVATLVLLAQPARAAFDALPQGVRAAGLCGAYCALGDDPEALLRNPAGIGGAATPALAVLADRPFGLQDLEQHLLAFAIPWREWRCGCGYTSLGRAGYYRETTSILALARRLGDRLVISLAAKTQGLDLRPNYGADWNYDFAIGVGWQPCPELRFGFSGDNLWRREVGRRARIRPPRSWRLGVARCFDHTTWLAADLVARSDREPELRLGQEVALGGGLLLRAGVRTALTHGQEGVPTRYSFGVGMEWWLLRVDYAFVAHPELGGTHHFGVLLRGSGGGAVAKEELPRIRHLVPTRRLDLNRATAEELSTVPGVDPALAARIVADRERRGAFSSVSELVRISGITAEQVSCWMPYLR
jgi:hypothetical protein